MSACDIAEVRHRLSVARLVADGANGFCVNPDNTSGRTWLPLAELVADDRCFAVRPRRTLVVADADSGEVAARLDQLAALAAAVGAPYLLCESSPGRRHLYLCARELPVDTIALLRFTMRAVGADSRTTGIRPPFTAHRDGRSRVAPVGGDVDALTAVEPAAVHALCRALRLPCLPSRLANAVRRGPLAGGYQSASEVRMALAVWATGAGVDRRWLTELLDDPECALHVSWRRRGGRWKAAEISRLFDKAARQVATVNPLARLDELDRHDWVGRTGTSERAVLETLCRHAGVTRDTALAVAELAALAGISYPTCQRALERLTRRGLLEIVTPPSATNATVWRPLPAVPAADSPQLWTATLTRDVADDLGADHVAAAVGRAAALAWRELDVNEPRVTKAVANKLNISMSAARARLLRLQTYELATRTDGGWIALGGDGYDIAARQQVAGLRARRMARVLNEREQRRQQRRQIARQTA